MSQVKKWKIQFFILFLFIFPQGFDYRLYFSLVLIIGLSSFFNRRVTKSSAYSLVPISLFLLVLISTLVRFFLLGAIDFKDFTEVGRLLMPTYMIIMTPFFKELKLSHIIPVLGIIVGIDFLITVMEFFYLHTSQTGIYSFIKGYYWSETHLLTPYRAKGLSPGPGQHAIFGVFMFIIFYSNFLFSKGVKSKYEFFIIIMAAFIVISSLSRTGAIGLFLSFALISLLYFKKIRRPKELFYFTFTIFLFFSIGIFFVSNNSEKLSRISLGIEKGVHDSSFIARQDVWDSLLNDAIERPSYLLIGWGKAYFGEKANQTDNEFLFIFLFYGLIFLLVFLVIIFQYILMFLLTKRKKDPLEIILFVSIIAGLLFAIPSSFFFYVPNLCMLTLLVIILKNTNENVKTINHLSKPCFGTSLNILEINKPLRN